MNDPAEAPLAARAFALVAFVAFFTACSDVVVLDGLREREAHEVVAALDRAAIPAQATRSESDDRMAVTVPPSDVARAVALFASQRLPHTPPAAFDDDLGERPLVQSGIDERARVAHAIGNDLARTLTGFPGVTDARVHLALVDPRDAPLDEPTTAHSTASVWIERADSTAVIDEPAVRRLVAGAVTGVGADDVTVVETVRTAIPVPVATLAWVGPFAVARATASRLMWFGLSVAVAFVLAVVLTARLARRR